MAVIRDTDRPSRAELLDHPPLEPDLFYGGDWLSWLNELTDHELGRALDWLTRQHPTTCLRLIAYAAGLYESHTYLLAQATAKGLYEQHLPGCKPDPDNPEPF